MKKLSLKLLLILIVSIHFASGQLDVQLIISPSPSPYISDWKNRRETATLIIRNTSTDVFFIRLHTRIYQGSFTSGLLQVQTVPEKMSVMAIEPGLTVLDPTELFPMEALEFYGGINEIVIRTGKLPANQYTICIQLLDAETFEPLTPDQCRPFLITDYQGPILILPENNSVIQPEAIRNIIFRWTPVVPQPSEPVLYKVAVFEVLPGQTPDIAFQSNYPILTKEEINNTFTLWTPDFEYPQIGMTYVWSVQAWTLSDVSGINRPIGQNNGWAEPFTFRIQERTTRIEVDCSCEAIKLAIQKRDCKSCYSLIINGLETDFECNIPIYVDINSSIQVKTEYSLECGEHQWLLSGTTLSRNSNYSPTDLTSSEYISEQFERTLSTSNITTFEISSYGKYELIHLINGQVISRYTFYTEEPQLSDRPKAGERHSIIILNPDDPCLGVVESDISNGYLTIIWQSLGLFTDFVITVYENPCGRYRDPIPPDTESPQKVVTTPGTRKDTETSDAVREIRSTRVGGRETRAGTSAQHTTSIPLGEILEGGDACIIQIEGTAVSEDGTTTTIYSSPVCLRYRPYDPEGIPVPTTPCDPPTTTTNNCSPKIKTLPGTEISLGAYVENNDLYKYPRAVAITADAVDWDIVEVQCIPDDFCRESPSSKQFAVRDLIGIEHYKWELIGKGSLNEPFDLDDISKKKDEIDEILKRIAQLRAEIDSLKQEKESRLNTLKIQQENAKNQLAIVDSTITTLEDSLQKVKNILVVKRDSLNIIISERISVSNKIKVKQDSTDVIVLDSISKYDTLLLNKPSNYELELYEKIADARDKLESAKEELKLSQQDIATESKKLQEAIINAGEEVKKKQEALNDINKLIEDNQRKVIALERKAYKLIGPFARISRDFMRDRDQFRRSMTSFILQNFPHGTTLYNTLTDISQFADATGEEIIGSSNKNFRLSLLTRFDSLNTSLQSIANIGCNDKQDTMSRALCNSSLSFTSSSINLYRQTLNNAINQNYVVDTLSADSIKRFQSVIRSYEQPQLQFAKTQLKQAYDTYNQALIDDSTVIAQMLKIQKDIKDTIIARENLLAKLEKELRDTTDVRETNFASNRIHYSSQKSTFEELRQLLLIDISRLSDTLAINREDSSGCIIEIINKQVDSTNIEYEITVQKVLKKTLEDILKIDSNQIKKEYEDKIAQKEDEIKNLEEKLKSLQDSLSNTLAGTKTATGPKVYYIPPPLEEIMKGKALFEELKKQVSEAEADLNLAKIDKQSGQKRLARMLERIGRLLMQYVNAEEKIKELEAAKKEAEGKLNEEDKKLTEYDEKLAGISQTAESAKSTSEKKLNELNPDKIKAELNEIYQDLLVKKVDVANSIIELNNAFNELVNKSKNLEQYRKQLTAITKQYEASLDKAGEIKTALTQNQNNVARMRAVNDYLRAVSANADLEKEKNKFEQQNRNIQDLEIALKLLNQNNSNKATELSETEKKFLEKIAELAEKMGELRDLFDSYFEKWNEYQAEKLQVAHWKVTKIKAEDLEGKVNDAEAKLNQMKKSDSLQKEFDVTKIDDQIRKYKDAKSNADSTITELVKEGKKLIKDWDEKIEEAEKKLKDKKEELRQFLLDEFNNVEHKVQLKITVNDQVVDRFRTKDAEKFIIKELIYPSQKTPEFANEYPDASPPSLENKPGKCQVDYTFKGVPPITASEPSFDKREPRTIALIYKNGEPLWPEWPVIPNSAPVLSKDIVVMKGNAQDSDLLEIFCKTTCQTIPIKTSIIELPAYFWRGDGSFYQINTGNPIQQILTYWEPPDVPKKLCNKDFDVINDFTSSRKGGDKDEKDKKTKPVIEPGILIEVPEKLIGWSEKFEEIKARIVKGDHTGLDGENVQYSVTLLDGEAKNYGFPKDTIKEVTTDANGYAPVEFNYGKGFARFEIKVKWYRKDTCITKTIEVESPIKVQMLRLASGLSKEALDGAVEVWEGASVSDVAGTMSIEDEKRIYGIAGLYDNYPNFINEDYIIFELDDNKLSVKPDSVETKLFGIGITYVEGDVPENAQLKLTSRCREVFKNIADPYEDSMELNTSKENKFKIGIDKSIFTVVMDEDFTAGELISGPGKLEITPGGLNPALLTQLLNIQLTADEVFVEREGDELIAQTGRVTWIAPDGLSVDLPGFTFTLDSLSLRAKQAAQMGGKISSSSDKLPHPVGFDAELYSDGEFFGNVYNLPEINISSFRLKQGASLAIDWSSTRSVESFSPSFKGIVIRTATLEFPNAFSKQNSPDKMALTVDNFGISKDGVQGTVAIQGEVEFGFAGFEMKLTELALEFQLGELKPNSIKLNGFLKPPSNIIDGTIAFSIKKSGSDWIGEIQTKGDILIPSIGLTVALNDGTKAEWNTDKGKGFLVINGKFKSRLTGEVELNNLKITSEGEIDADAIVLNTNATLVVRGFSLNLDKVSLVKESGEGLSSQYAIELQGGFGFPSIAVQKVEGKLTVHPGLKLSIKVSDVDIKFDYGPVEFSGKIKFGNNLFSGKFNVGVKQPKFGLECSFIIGTQEIDADNFFTFWYAEMQLQTGATGIPLGNTGLAITRLGGGVGWNYDPPVGSQEGAPRKTDGFAFKAMIGIGTVPGGKFLNSLFTMVYTPSKFSLGGKLWLLEQEDNIFAEGVLNLYFDNTSPNAIDGFVKSFVGIHNADGKIVRLDGKINYKITRNGNINIESETLKGAVLDLLKAEGKILVNENLIDLNGRIYLDFYSDDISVAGVLTLIVDFHAEALGNFRYEVRQTRLYTRIRFAGHIDVNLDTPLGVADILSGRTEVMMTLDARPQVIRVTGFAYFSYNVWIYKGSAKVDFGFTI